MTERGDVTPDEPAVGNRNIGRSVILIESDSDDDGLTNNERRSRNLAVSGPGVLNEVDGHGALGGNEEDGDDDLSIFRETGRQADSDTHLDAGTEYIDLERESVSGENDRNSQLRMMAYDEGHSTPAADSGEGGRDDGLMIVQERRAAPAIRLSVPGRGFMEISASPYDRPVRRSFERQEHYRQLRHPGRRRLRRAAERTGQSRRQIPEDDAEDDDYRPASVGRLPTRLIRRRRQEFFRPQQGPYGGGDSILAELRARIDSFSPDIRSAFTHAQTVSEFRCILQSVDPLMWQECNGELEQLYNAYRARMSIVAADQASRVPRGSSQSENRSFQYVGRVGPLGLHVDISGGLGESLTNYLLENEPGRYAMMAYPGAVFDEMDEEARTQSIVNAIQEREERERDIRVKNFSEKSRPQEEKFLQKCRGLPQGYSASFNTKIPPTMEVTEDGKERTMMVDDRIRDEWEEVAVCCLCGVELGVGIPDDFEGMTKEDRGATFQSLTAKYEFHCPYQSLTRPTKVDRDLSRKTFVAPCGHTYCGRCVVRIRNAGSRCSKKDSKKKYAGLKGSSHPDNYGPKTCPATHCKQPIRSPKAKMREAFL
ncbi:hypothetical protein HG536_0G02900 [Torulaspora globosa]|uniref:RING-type domain-containing protein n=1 Tax=Torulaspora globosa TaxID=48254 RepID=A0A7G3ZLP2_9SACH|nr:uncharacterized protein HG536_0G02900 [Torulaspora globosa]QLL34428.1 hypothetical protein HG536_0G02900 [Torulaspora globosa]